MRRRFRFSLAAACGVLAMLLAISYADAARAEAEEERAEALARYGGEVTSLVVATQELAEGEDLGDTSVETREWLADLAPEGAITTADDVVGRTLTSPVAKGEVLTELDFAEQDDALEVPSGRVAVSVQVSDKTGVSSDVARGALVQAYELKEGAAELIATGLEVLDASGSAARMSASGVVTLAALPSEVPRILSAGAAGTLRLVQPAEDAARPEGAATTEAQPADDAAQDGAAAEGAGQSGGTGVAEGDSGQGGPAQSQPAEAQPAEAQPAEAQPAEGGEA